MRHPKAKSRSNSAMKSVRKLHFRLLSMRQTIFKEVLLRTAAEAAAAEKLRKTWVDEGDILIFSVFRTKITMAVPEG